MRWSCLQFNVLLLPESYRRLSAETRGKPLSPPPYTARAHPWKQYSIKQLAGHPKTTFFLLSWVLTIQTVVLTADVFKLFIQTTVSTPNRNPPELLVKHTSHIHKLFRLRRQHIVRVFSHIRIRYFSEGSVQQHPPPYSFRKRVRIKNKTPSRTNQQYVVQPVSYTHLTLPTTPYV